MSFLVTILLTCGTERWDIKMLTDKDANKVDINHIYQSSVLALMATPVPFKKWSNTLSRQPAEQFAYTIIADVLAFKVEDDGDIHIVLASIGNVRTTMIAEIPSDECMIGSRAEKPVAMAKASFIQIFGPLPKQIGKLKVLLSPVRVNIAGVLFFDKLHHQTGVAPNGIELHPVLSIDIVK